MIAAVQEAQVAGDEAITLDDDGVQSVIKAYDVYGAAAAPAK